MPSIYCSINGYNFYKTFYDTGLVVNIIAAVTYRLLFGTMPLKPTYIQLQMADQTFRKVEGIVSVFSPRGITPTSKFVCVLPFPDGDARRHKDLSWFGREKALRPAGEGSLYYLAPKCLYRGEYKRGMECVSSTAYGVALRSIPESLLL